MSNNEEILTSEDYKLFDAIAKDIKNNPTKYIESGKWLDEYCSEDAYWQRQENKLKELREQQKKIPVLPIVQQVKQLEEEIEIRRTPALLVRFQEARGYLLEKYKDQSFIPEDVAKKIIIITWLLTDPDAEKANLGITQFENWSWEPIDDVTGLSRGFAQFLWCKGGGIYYPWMKLVRVGQEKVKVGGEKWYKTSTFKYVVIPIVATLFVGIPAWISLTRDSQTTESSSKEVEEKLAKIEEIAAPPTLSLMPGTITKNDSEHTRLLWFKPSKNEPLGRITFVAKVLGDSRVKIIEFYSEGPTTLERKEISEDGKEAELAYSLIGFYYPRIVLRTSNSCKVLVSGSHITKPITVEIE